MDAMLYTIATGKDGGYQCIVLLIVVVIYYCKFVNNNNIN